MNNTENQKPSLDEKLITGKFKIPTETKEVPMISTQLKATASKYRMILDQVTAQMAQPKEEKPKGWLNKLRGK